MPTTESNAGPEGQALDTWWTKQSKGVEGVGRAPLWDVDPRLFIED